MLYHFTCDLQDALVLMINLLVQVTSKMLQVKASCTVCVMPPPFALDAAVEAREAVAEVPLEPVDVIDETPASSWPKCAPLTRKP